MELAFINSKSILRNKCFCRKTWWQTWWLPVAGKPLSDLNPWRRLWFSCLSGIWYSTYQQMIFSYYMLSTATVCALAQLCWKSVKFLEQHSSIKIVRTWLWSITKMNKVNSAWGIIACLVTIFINACKQHSHGHFCSWLWRTKSKNSSKSVFDTISTILVKCWHSILH